jgi:hypothetical protein
VAALDEIIHVKKVIDDASLFEEVCLLKRHECPHNFYIGVVSMDVTSFMARF